MSHLLSAARLRRSASFRRLTGISAATFEQMLKRLRAPWEEMQRSKRKSGRPWEIGGLEEHLLVLLLDDRCTITQAFIGFFYQADRSVICRAIQRIEGPVQRLFGIRRAPQISRTEAEALLIDCTEQPIQRPKNDATQRAHYSGKKNATRRKPSPSSPPRGGSWASRGRIPAVP